MDRAPLLVLPQLMVMRHVVIHDIHLSNRGSDDILSWPAGSLYGITVSRMAANVIENEIWLVRITYYVLSV